MKLAANISMMYTEWAFEDLLAKAAEDGFRYLECMFPYEVPVAKLQQTSAATGMQFVLINAHAGNWEQGERGLAVLPENRDRFKRSVDLAVEYANGLDVKQVHVLAGTVADGSSEKAKDCYLENLRWLLDHTRQEGLIWNIEPINTRDVPGYFLTTQKQAHDIVQLMGSDRLKVQMDLYHCQIMEGDIVAKLNQYLPTGRVGHIQIAGVPERHEPNLSELDYTRVFHELRKLRYVGWIGCEYRPKTSTREGLAWLKAPEISGTM